MPVTAVARETRRLDRQHGADATFADRRKQALKAWPRYAAAGTSEIIIDHLDPGPAELPRAIGDAVLATPALLIVQELIGRRLTHVDEGAVCKMLSRDLGHRRPPRLPGLRRFRAAGPPPVSPAGSPVSVPARRLARLDRTV